MAITPLQSRIEEILSGNTNKTPHLSRIEFLLVDLIEFIQTGMSSVFHYKGSVATYADLQNVSNPAVGDVYNVQADGMDYAWDGTAWDNLGSIITIATEITSDGQSPVTSEAIYNALALKADTTALANTATSISAIGTCDTAGNVAEKVVTMPQGWTLRTGSIIGVLFSNTNIASNVTLNVAGTGAKAIRAGSGTSVTRDVFCGKANFYTYYMYDGTNWVWLNYNYCPPKISTAEIDAGTSTDDRVISAQRLKYATDKATENVIGINSSGNDYIELKSGVRLYITDTTPTGTIPTGSVGIGF